MEEKGRQGWKKTVWQLTRELNAVSWLTVPFPTHVMMTCTIRNNRRRLLKLYSLLKLPAQHMPSNLVNSTLEWHGEELY
jgi:putative AlgH/UPF0301 family transcriptional regulator